MGKQFELQSRAARGEGDLTLSPELQADERILCYVRRDGDKVQHVPNRFFGTVRQELDSEQYQHARHMAECMAQLDQAISGEKKFRVLSRLLSSPDSVVAAWSGNQLRTNRSVSVPEGFFRKQLENQDLTAAALVEIDKALLAEEKNVWQHSVRRTKLFNRLASQRSSPENAKRVFRHLSHTVQHPETQGFELETLLGILRKAFENVDVAATDKTQIAVTVGWIPRRYDDHERAFQFALDQIASSKFPEIRLALTLELVHFFPNDDRGQKLVSILHQVLRQQAGSAQQHELTPGSLSVTGSRPVVARARASPNGSERCVDTNATTQLW